MGIEVRYGSCDVCVGSDIIVMKEVGHMIAV